MQPNQSSGSTGPFARSAPGAAHPEAQALSACDARTLLGKLRDLDLRDERLEIAPGLTVDVAGCLSLDAPADGTLRYLLREKGGNEHVLAITWSAGALELLLDPGQRRSAAPPRRVPLLSDSAGRASAPEIRARLDPQSTNRREVEHFLRRLVRAAFASRN